MARRLVPGPKTTSWGYLGISLNNVLYTVNAYVPARRNRLLYAPSFFASWITIELAWFHLIWQVALTGVAAALGAFRHRPGRIGLALMVANWVGLAVTIKHSIDARREIHEAFVDLLERGRPMADPSRFVAIPTLDVADAAPGPQADNVHDDEDRKHDRRCLDGRNDERHQRHADQRHGAAEPALGEADENDRRYGHRIEGWIVDEGHGRTGWMRRIP